MGADIDHDDFLSLRVPWLTPHGACRTRWRVGEVEIALTVQLPMSQLDLTHFDQRGREVP